MPLPTMTIEVAMRPSRPCASPRDRRWASTALIAAVTALAQVGQAREAEAQAQVRDFTRPFVALRTGGHAAPIRAIAFGPDGRQLYTAGMDKQVLVWDVATPRPGLARTIRPPRWRGLRGAIYAMAIGPDAADGSRTVAEAGNGVIGGEIGLYRDPSPHGPATGERFATLPPHNPALPAASGHSGAVTGLAFRATGTQLVSIGVDGRVLVWDVANRRVASELAPAGDSPANALALDATGRWLAVGFGDGRVMLWDMESRSLRAENGPWLADGGARRGAPGAAINALDLSLDGRWLVVGREDGRLVRVESPFLTNPTLLPRGGLGRGPVEAVAISPDGRRVAASIVRHRWEDPTRPPRVESDVVVLRLLDGASLPPTFGADPIDFARSSKPAGALDGPTIPLDARARAVEFSPDGHRIAVAGGHDQAIHLVDVAEPGAVPVVLRGDGSAILRVGFSKDSAAILLTRPLADLGDQDSETIAYELAARLVRNTDPVAEAPRPIVGDWEVVPEGPSALIARSAAEGREFRVELDPGLLGRWWDHAFLPGNVGAGHPDDTLAVAAEGGVVIHRLRDGARTRVFSGHEGGVLSLAPSPDGRWLVTGSDDQTARLWTLQGCDHPPALGTRFGAVPDGQGRRVVAEVEPLGFAEAMGLQVGDAIEVVAIGRVQRDVGESFGVLDSVPPGVEIAIGARRGAEFVPMTTTRRDAPALSLFVTANRDWVAWMPEGYYDTLLAGDRDHLGWHRNGALAFEPGGSPTFDSTDFFAADIFEADLRRPEVLDALIATADRTRALALVPAALRDPGALAESAAPPTLRVLAPADLPAEGPLQVAGDELVVTIRAETGDSSPLQSLTVDIDGRRALPVEAINPPVAEAVERLLRVPLIPGRQRVSILAENAAGRRRRLALDVESGVAPTEQPRLAIVAVGAGGPFPDDSIPAIEFADADTAALAAFFAAPDDRPRFDRIEPVAALGGPAATASTIREAMESPAVANLGPGDAAFVTIEAHILGAGDDRTLFGSDALADGPSGRLAASEITTALSGLAARGCRVTLLVEGEHEPSPAGPSPQLAEWARTLSRAGVIVFLASEVGPSQPPDFVEGRGIFAQAIVTATEARSLSRPLLDPDAPMTLDDFRVVVLDRVAELSSRRQFAAGLIPETISPSIPIFEPGVAPDSTPEGR